VEVPLHLLRYVCLFCGKHGLSLMKECFETGTPESLPFPIAHAFITIVSNVSPRLLLACIQRRAFPMFNLSSLMEGGGVSLSQCLKHTRSKGKTAPKKCKVAPDVTRSGKKCPII